MFTPICMLACAMTVGQASDRGEWLLSPQLAPGLELVYLGTYVDESLIPNVQYQQQYRLETQILVLESGQRASDVAVMTSLSMRDPKQPEKQPKGAAFAPATVRLELMKIDAQGRVKGAGGSVHVVSLQGPPLLECGAFVDVPATKVSKNSFWPVNEEGRPARTWTVAGTENCGGLPCIKLIGEQQSDDWDQPRADRTAWRRRDTVWLIPQVGVAQKVERVIERRDPARREPTHRATVRYELESRLKFPGRLFDDRREDIIKAKKFQEEAQPLLAEPSQYRGQIDALIKKMAHYVENQSPTPYRMAIVQLQGRLDKARKGEIVPVGADIEPPPEKTTFGIGHKIPDFVVTDLISKQSTRFNGFAGKPVLVFFYNPDTQTGKEVLDFALKQAEKHGNKVGVLAMAVNADADLVRKQHLELRLPFNIHDGKGLHQTFAVEATPRLVVIDGEGVVRAASTGWGFHTPREIMDELSRCLPK